jgi:hypothetical protein
VHEYIKKLVEVLIEDVGAATTDRDLHNTCITGAVEFQDAGGGVAMRTQRSRMVGAAVEQEALGALE